jgi:hypothetical protein
MNHKIRSTMTGVLVALSFAIGGGILGDAPIQTNLTNADDSNAIPSNVTTPSESNVHDQRVRRHIGMPYFSFGNVFPK